MRAGLVALAKRVVYPAMDVLWAAKRGLTNVCPVCERRGSPTVIRGYGRIFLKCPSCSHIRAHDYSNLRADLGMGWDIGVDPTPGSEVIDPEAGGASEEFLSRFCTETFGIKSILLYGAGPTRAFRTLHDDGFDVYGCDVSRDVIAYRQREFASERFFHIRDLGQRRFDLVVATEVIEHLFDPIRTFRLIASVLEPQGMFCGSTSFSVNGEIEDDDGFGYMRPRGHVVYWSEPSLRAAFARLDWTMHAFSMKWKPSNRRFFLGAASPSRTATLDALSRQSTALPYTDILMPRGLDRHRPSPNCRHVRARRMSQQLAEAEDAAVPGGDQRGHERRQRDARPRHQVVGGAAHLIASTRSA